ncbi:MAG TPA: bifunctional hydroxymethylpyrimidine kinase/phosphomethylpyrimidine kinase [Gryllotalpicola sp.]
MTPSAPRVLSIAGSDPSGGAGIQADLKSIAALGGYGMAAITALTAQNTREVRAVHVPPAGFLRSQLDTVADDVAIDAVKIGMLGEASVITVVRDWLAARRPPAVVLDPVMIATSGARLLDADAEAALRDLLPLAELVTPNLPELAVLCGEPEAASWPEAIAQAAGLASAQGIRVLVKGGHLGGDRSPDALVEPDGTFTEFDAERIDTRSTHGTGCSLSSAVATRYAAGHDWREAVREAKAWLSEAIRAGARLEVGSGHGPVDHFVAHRVEPPQAHTARWWEESADIRRAIDALPFLVGLADGTLDERVFRHYLEQDALYLREYSRVLAKASALAPSREEQAFWADAARSSLLGELRLHDEWLGGEPRVTPSAVNRAYLDHLAAAGPDYGTVVAAVLPCYWIYQDVGERLVRHARPGHPYRGWLESYGAPAFAESTRQAVHWAGVAAANAGPAERERMSHAFRLSARHELAFFAQEPGGTPR